MASRFAHAATKGVADHGVTAALANCVSDLGIYAWRGGIDGFYMARLTL